VILNELKMPKLPRKKRTRNVRLVAPNFPEGEMISKKKGKIYQLKESKYAVAMKKSSQVLSVPEDQWKLPIGYSENGNPITLLEYQEKPNVVASLESLSSKSKKILVAERIRLNKSYPTRFMVGVGLVDKKVALEEVQKESSAGKFIIESEQKVINRMKTLVQREMSAYEGSVH
jgi:hypothetical protein